MDFLPKEIEDYVAAHSQNEPELLKQLNRETQLKVLNPRMLAGAFQGRVLAMLTHMIQPKNILEIGTYTGYSALCFAEALPDDGKVVTIDLNPELSEIQDKYFRLSEHGFKIERHFGNALEVIPELKRTFQLVFIDADKENYSNYFDLVFPKLPVGAYIIADNVLWSGKVTTDSAIEDIDTQALIEFNKKVQSDERIQNVLFPIRDGLMICRKIKD